MKEKYSDEQVKLRSVLLRIIDSKYRFIEFLWSSGRICKLSYDVISGRVMPCNENEEFVLKLYKSSVESRNNFIKEEYSRIKGKYSVRDFKKVLNRVEQDDAFDMISLVDKNFRKLWVKKKKGFPDYEKELEERYGC